MLRRNPSDPIHARRLAISELHENCTFTRNTVTAWYRLGDQHWSFASDARREQMIYEFATALSKISGHSVHSRVTSKLYPAAEWRAGRADNVIAPLPGWDTRIDEETAVVGDTDENEVYFGVSVKKSRSWNERLYSAARGCFTGASPELDDLTDTLEQVQDALGGPSTDGVPATASDIEWLLHRSTRLLMPEVPRLSFNGDGRWSSDDLAQIVNGVHYEYRRGGKSVKITADYDGEEVSRYVVIQTLGRVGNLEIPQVAGRPWQVSSVAGVPVEWSSRFDVLSGPEVKNEVRRKLFAIRDQQKQYAEHDIEEPLELEELAHHARVITKQITGGNEIEASRAYGWHRIAVAGDTEDEALRNARKVRDYFRPQQMDIIHPQGIKEAGEQYNLYREFIPGEPLATTAYKRRLQTLHVAGGMPHVTSGIGDQRGMYIGYTRGVDRRPVFLDLWHAMEDTDSSGVVPILGEPGAGKSGLLAALIVSAVEDGVTSTVLDPSGLLANLTKIPHIAPYAEHLDAMKAEEGTYNPWAVIPVPIRENFDTDEEWVSECANKASDRRLLARDVIDMILPPSIAQDKQTSLVLSDALRAVGGTPNGSMFDVCDRLDEHDDPHAQRVANTLRDLAELPLAKLFFANNSRDQSMNDKTLLVTTMNGIQLPNENSDPNGWTTSERLAVPMLHLASYHATSRSYGLPRDWRKLVALDEAGKLGEWGYGKTLFNNLGVDSRKFNIAVLASNQNPGALLNMDIENYFGASFVGRIRSNKIAAQALTGMLRVEPDQGYEKVLASLSPHVKSRRGAAVRNRGAREFIHRDVEGAVDRVVIDLEHKPYLLEAIKTTPAPKRQRLVVAS